MIQMIQMMIKVLIKHMEEMGIQGRKFVEENFSWKIITQNFVDNLRRTICEWYYAEALYTTMGYYGRDGRMGVFLHLRLRRKTKPPTVSLSSEDRSCRQGRWARARALPLFFL